jgi:hypothetical protein
VKFLQPDNTIDVISSKISDQDHSLFFGPINHPPLITSSRNIGDILFELELIPSKGWARKNNWWKEIPPGFHEFVFGKNKIKIYVLLDMPQDLG